MYILRGSWKVSNTYLELGCECNLSGSSDSSCDGTGDCGPCNEGYSGLKCSNCLSGYYSTFSSGCLPCECNTSGTIGGSADCDDIPGFCSCDFGYSGDKCDTCSSGYRSSGTLCIGNIRWNNIHWNIFKALLVCRLWLFPGWHSRWLYLRYIRPMQLRSRRLWRFDLYWMFSRIL